MNGLPAVAIWDNLSNPRGVGDCAIGIHGEDGKGISDPRFDLVDLGCVGHASSFFVYSFCHAAPKIEKMRDGEIKDALHRAVNMGQSHVASLFADGRIDDDVTE